MAALVHTRAFRLVTMVSAAVLAVGAVPGLTSAHAQTAPALPMAESSSVITIGWAGDMTPGSSAGNPGHGGRDLFAKVRTQLREPDLMIVNLEGTYATAGGPTKCDGSTSGSCFTFRAPLSYAKALRWSGIDAVSLANNHTYDFKARGLAQTKAQLKTNKIAYTGMAGQITVRRVKGMTVALIGFSPYSRNNNVNDIANATRLVKRAAKKADVVVVVAHLGAEGVDKRHTPKKAEYAYGERRGNPRAFAHAVVKAGADLVLGSGPHVLRGIEKYRGRLIAYSLGNFAGKNFNTRGLGGISGILAVQLTKKGTVHGGQFVSVILGSVSGVPALDRKNRGLKLVRSLSRQDFTSTFALDPTTGRFTH